MGESPPFQPSHFFFSSLKLSSSCISIV
uniref:Uncharacterized protein n=1 Tax=Rhizophora mucronata TaxID=61149 RepID=A0A2P2R335_RHIMU